MEGTVYFVLRCHYDVIAVGSIEIPIGMKDIAEKRRGGHSMNRACERLCFSRQKIHLSSPLSPSYSPGCIEK